jgi:hypothetical protein
MASAESVKMGSLVRPAEAKMAYEADVADPGQIEKAKTEQRAHGIGKYGSTPAKPPEQEQSNDEPLTWIEIQLVDDDGQPIPSEVYVVKTSDNHEYSGTLDDKGFARIEGIRKGSVTVTFPRLDEQYWMRA